MRNPCKTVTATHWRMWHYRRNLWKSNGRFDITPSLCILIRASKVISFCWLCWEWTWSWNKVMGTRKEFRERVKKDIAMWRQHFPKEGEEKPLITIKPWML